MAVPEEILFMEKLGYEVTENSAPKWGVAIAKEGHILAKYTGSQLLFIKNPISEASLRQLKNVAILRKESRERGIDYSYAASAVGEDTGGLVDTVIKIHLREILEDW